jgi:hypothetical protein
MPSANEISEELIRSLPDKRAALRTCVLYSGKPLKTVAYELGIKPDHLSKMLNPADDPRHFPQEKEDLLMDVCGNEIPLIWANMRRGHPTRRQVAELEAEIVRLQVEIVKQGGEHRHVLNIFKQLEVR